MKAVFVKYEPLLKIIASVFIIFLLFTTKEEAQDHLGDGIHLQAIEEKYDIGHEILVLKDKNNEFELTDVSAAPLNWSFMPVDQKILKSGSTEETFWIEFKTDNVNNSKEKLLVMPRSSIETAILYTPNNSGGYSENLFSPATAEEAAAYSPNDIVFALDTGNEESSTYYMKIEAEGSFQFPVSIWTRNAYGTTVRNSMLLSGIFIGMCVFVFLFQLMQFYKKKQKIYLYFMSFAIFILLMSSLLSDYTFLNVIPSLVQEKNNILVFTLGFSNISGVLYIHSFLEKTSKEKAAKKFFNRSAFFAVVLMLFQFISLPVAGFSLVLLSAVNIIYILLVIVKSRKYGKKYSSLQLASFLLFLTALLLFGLAFLNWITFYGFFEKVFLLTLLAGIALSALALQIKDKTKAMEIKKRENKMVQRLQMEVETLKKLDDNKNELLEVTAHSLRTPLYGMIGIAESFAEESKARLLPNQAKQIEVIAEYGKKLAHKLNDLTDFSKIKQNTLDIHVESVSLNHLIDEVLEVSRPLLHNPEIRLYSTLIKDLPEIIADPYRIQQILYNLIDNAIKYTDEGEIVISAKRTGKQLAVTVRDTGSGIEKDRMQNLFEPYKQGEGANIGIGLSISKRLIELHGGWLKAESKKNTGTTFTFTLPINDEEVADSTSEDYSVIEEINAAELKESLSSTWNNKKVKVLVVEKETLDRNILMEQLRKEKYEVTGTGAGSIALQLMENLQIDLIVMDWSLEDMSGNELCRKIREKYTMTEIPILMLSTKIGLKEKMEAFSSGANDYLIKPCDKEEFLLRTDTLANLKVLTQEITNMNNVLERNVQEKTMALEITNMNLVTVNDEIQEIEKSRNEMLSSISHELGTPITLIHSYIQAVQESLIDEKNPRYLDMIHKKLLLLERLTEDLVELGKYKSGNMTLRFESLDFDHWLTRLIAAMEADIRQSGRLFEYTKSESEKMKGEGYRIALDVDRIDQVFSNILWNAVKNTSSVDGKITISTKICNIAEEVGETDEDKKAAEIIFTISDTGYGIPEEVLPHIFDRFFKLDNNSNKKGSGLGLAIAKEIVLSHKGRIWAESEAGVGSSFFIALPLYK